MAKFAPANWPKSRFILRRPRRFLLRVALFEAQMPSGKESNARHLTEIVPEDLFVGTSLLIRQGDRFLFGIRPAKRDGDDFVLELTGISDALEDADVSFTAGVQREAKEEIGNEPRPDLRQVRMAATSVVAHD